MMEVKLPRFDEDKDQSLVIFWYKQEGERVKKGDVLLEVQTEKVVNEIEAEVDGYIHEIKIKRGEVASVNDVLCTILTENDDESMENIRDEKVENKKEKSKEEVNSDNFVRVAPRLRKLAQQLDVNLIELQNSLDKGSKITEEMIRNFADKTQSIQGSPLIGIRKTIATRMKNSLMNTAQLTETTYADVTELANIRDHFKQKMSWNSWIIYATVQALKNHPYMNGTFEGNYLNIEEKIHLGIATDTDEGLFVPVIFDAHEKSLIELNDKISQVITDILNKKITPNQLTGSTFTVTNLGSFGIHFFTPIINPPELAILGIGAIETYFSLNEDGEIIERKRIPLSLTFDHQVIDGAPAARFLQTLTSYLESPSKLL